MVLEKCYKCGAENKTTHKFCNKCGTDLKAKTICPYCKSSIPIAALKCANCGEWVNEKKEMEIEREEIKKEISRYDTIVTIGWIFALLGGWIGFLIGLYLITRESKEVRNKGKAILVFSILVSLLLTPLIFY